MTELKTDAVAEMARRMKLELVTKYGDDPDDERSDMHGYVAVVRNGRPVALVHIGHGLDAARQCVYYAAALLRADELVLVTDARFRQYQPPPDISETERERLFEEADRAHRHGQFQDEWKTGQRDGLTECLVIQRIPALGPSTMTMYPYVRDRRKLTWQKDHIADGQQAVQGAIPDYARDGFNAAREHTTELVAQVEGLWVAAGNEPFPPDKREYHLDRALACFASEREGVGAVTVLSDGSRFVDGEEL